MKLIQLTQGYFAMVDDCDFDSVSVYKWYSAVRPRTVYAMRHLGSKTISMHQQIMGFPKLNPDHKDGNGLNNQRHNLRIATKSQNSQNSRKQSIVRSSKFKGVCFNKNPRAVNHWMATIKLEGKSHHIGSFPSEMEAAIAYDSVAVKMFGEFANLNF